MEKRDIIFLIILILILALVSRLIYLNVRPLHLDESVDWFFAKNIIDGKGYTYNPENFHGTSYYYFIAGFFYIFGVSEYSLRLTSAVAGIILISLLMLLRFKDDNFNNYGKYITAILITVSASIMYYSRDCRQEAVLILFSFLAIYFLNLILEKKDLNYLPLFTIFLALSFVTKETTILLLMTIIVILGFNFKTLSTISFKKGRNILLLSIMLFIFIWFMFYTSFLTNPSGFLDSFKGYFFWTNHGVGGEGHNKPFYYFPLLLIQYELPLLLFGLVGIFFAIKNKSQFFRNVSLWFIIITILYCAIPYKTPWLEVNFVLPLCILSGYAMSEIFTRKEKLGIVLIVISIAWLSIFSIYLNFIIPYQEENKLAYAHTDMDIIKMSNLVHESSANNVLIISKDYWPLPFYLRDKTLYYLDSNASTFYDNINKYPLLVIDADTFKLINTENTTYKKYSIRPWVYIYLISNSSINLNTCCYNG